MKVKVTDVQDKVEEKGFDWKYVTENPGLYRCEEDGTPEEDTYLLSIINPTGINIVLFVGDYHGNILIADDSWDDKDLEFFPVTNKIIEIFV